MHQHGRLVEDPGWDTESIGLSFIAEEFTRTNPGFIPKASSAANAAYMEKGWQRVGMEETGYGGDRDRVLRLCRWLYYNNAWAHNILNAYQFLTVGENVAIEFVQDKMARRWSEIEEYNGWERRHKKIVRDTYLLGEWFAVVIPETKDKPARVRGIEPLEITRIHTERDDVESVTGYQRDVPLSILGANGNSLSDDTLIPPDNVVHTRVLDVGNQKRGTPVIFSALRYLRMAEKFLQSRHWLNLTRARIPVVRKVIGSSVDVTAQKTVVQTLPPPGSYVVENGNVEWQYPSLNVEGTESKPDLRALLLTISAAVSLPEYLVTGDASNANYSSTLVAEAPMVRMFRDYQGLFVPAIRRIVKLAVPGSDPKVTAPPVIRRRIKDIAESIERLYGIGVISRETSHEWLGLNSRVEEKRIATEQANADHAQADMGKAIRQELRRQQSSSDSPGRAEAS